MHLDERSDQFWQLTNQGGMATSTVFPTRIPVMDPPGPFPQAGQGVFATGDGMINCGAGGEYTSRRVSLKPFGTGPGGATFAMAVYGWVSTTGSFFNYQGPNFLKLQIPSLLATYNITLGSNTGVQGTDLGPQFNFAGTVTQTFGPTFFASTNFNADDYFMLSPPAGNSATISIPTLGVRHMEVTFQLGTATSANCLYRKV